MSLSDRKDYGPMEISATYLKNNIKITSVIITDAINTILATGRIPDVWKQCYIVPIPKKGSLSEIENYRGIYIQSCILKILANPFPWSHHLQTPTWIHESKEHYH